MNKWEKFEQDCVEFLNKTYGMYARFTHKGGADSAVPDILVETRQGFCFYIEAKHSPAQCGQFVLLPDIMTQTFQYSKQNTDSINSLAQMIIEYMNQKFDDYRNAGTAGKEIVMPGSQEIFAAWIAEHYRKKGVQFFITNGFKIIPIRQFRECFEISATYRVKRSGSSDVGKKRISVVKDFLFRQDYEIRNVQTEGNKLFITSDLPYHDQRFILNEYEYMFSQRGERYEIRKLSNTYNANVIFSVKLNEYASGLTDQEFITALI